MMEAPSTSVTSVNFYQISRRNNPEDSHLHTCRRENIKSHNISKRFVTLLLSPLYVYLTMIYKLHALYNHQTVRLWMTNWEVLRRRKRSWAILMYYPSICHLGLMKTTINFNWYRQSPCQDSNRGPPEYDAVSHCSLLCLLWRVSLKAK
jgi:hypothetical protein